MNAFDARSVDAAVIPVDAAGPGSRLGWRTRFSVVVWGVVLLMGFGGVSDAGQARAAAVTPDPHAESFDVSFGDCSELASITTISIAEARTVVPASFTLGGDLGAVPFVVRVADCGAMSIGGSEPRAERVAQLGVSIVSPDGTGDINNYTALYYTTSQRLALKLQLAGVPAQYAPQLKYDLVPNADRTAGTLSIGVAGRPAFRIAGPIVEPPSSTVPFLANWWIRSGVGHTKMSTFIPTLRFGLATSTLQTPPGGRLGRLLGSSTETFALLDSFNRFADARMSVTITPA